MRKLPLTTKEEKVYGFILGYVSDNGYSPTLSEIAEHIGSKQHQVADYFLKQLESKGFVKRGKGWRNIKIITRKV